MTGLTSNRAILTALATLRVWEVFFWPLWASANSILAQDQIDVIKASCSSVTNLFALIAICCNDEVWDGYVSNPRNLDPLRALSMAIIGWERSIACPATYHTIGPEEDECGCTLDSLPGQACDTIFAYVIWAFKMAGLTPIPVALGNEAIAAVHGKSNFPDKYDLQTSRALFNPVLEGLVQQAYNFPHPLITLSCIISSKLRAVYTRRWTEMMAIVIGESTSTASWLLPRQVKRKQLVLNFLM